MYMLDTDTCSYVLKKRSDKLRHKFKAIKELCISSITYGELCYGIEFGEVLKQKERWEQLDMFARRLFVEPWNEEAAKHYGQIRSYLNKLGTPIGNNDTLIAAHARSINAILVTNNVREFGRVPELNVENWMNS
jgi:tRNA(fMet)-specific endonuclease VapC